MNMTTKLSLLALLLVAALAGCKPDPVIPDQPDDWNGTVHFNNPDLSSTDFSDNTVNAGDWESLQSSGVAFLPAAGIRIEEAQTAYVQSGGVYWASNPSSNDMAYTMYFIVGEKQRGIDANYRHLGASVRLVRDE